LDISIFAFSWSGGELRHSARHGESDYAHPDACRQNADRQVPTWTTPRPPPPPSTKAILDLPGSARMLMTSGSKSWNAPFGGTAVEAVGAQLSKLGH
jgi:hypothetical protein